MPARVVIALDTELDLLVLGAFPELAVLTVDTIDSALASTAHKFFRLHIPFAGGLRQLFVLVGNEYRARPAIQAAICVVSESHCIDSVRLICCRVIPPGSHSSTRETNNHPAVHNITPEESIEKQILGAI